jgi:hypothetical protein
MFSGAVTEYEARRFEDRSVVLLEPALLAAGGQQGLIGATLAMEIIPAATSVRMGQPVLTGKAARSRTDGGCRAAG